MQWDRDLTGFSPDAPPSPDWSSVLQSWWQIPLVLYTSWWNSVVEAIWPDPAVEAFERREHADESDVGTLSGVGGSV